MIGKRQKRASRPIRGDRRCVKAVAVVGKTKNQASKEALVQFYGR